MEFWPENQGQSALYSRFGTIPGRNCTHNYHDRHQATHYPLYYGEQQDQGRESSYWTVPGSRTGGAPQEYTRWTDQELTTAASSHFPFILDRHPQHHQDLGEYQPHEARDREWTAAQRAARQYDRGFLRDGWQRRWEPCSPVRYNREVCTKRSDSSYRELEAWAARYSHSLPRRRRIEAELRGASQGLLESSRTPERDSRSGTDPRVAALQQVIQSGNIRESGLWERGGRQHAPNYYPSQTPATDTGHMLDMKEKTSYQRRAFSQPPGYIAPPPYNSPHKSSPVLPHSDTSWEQEGKRQTHWSQPTLRKQDVSVDHRKGEKEDFTKPDATQYTFPELEGLKHRRHETDALQPSSPISIQKPDIPCEGVLSLQQPQVLQAVQNKNITEEPSSKVIEGRKFRLNKKTGGMTIFCLVSRIAGTTETPTLPLCTFQTNIQNTGLGGGSTGLSDSGDINQRHKLADEVDFRVPTLTEQSSTSDVRNLKAQQETPSCVESETLTDNLSNKADTDVVSSDDVSSNDTESAFRRQVSQSVQPVSVKYPLWREPSFTSRAETESSSKCLKENSEEGESDQTNQEDSGEVHPIDIEVRRLDIKKDTESEDSKGLLVIDTTCVVVKMELIPSPKKEHVHYVDSTSHTEHSPLDIQSTDSPEHVQSNSQLTKDAVTDKNAGTDLLHINEKSETELDSDLTEKKAPEEESEISFPCMSSSSVSGRETLEERAERILGIPLHDCVIEQQPEDATSPLDSCVEDQEVEPPPIKDNDNHDAIEETPENKAEGEQSQNQLEVGPSKDATCLQEIDTEDQQVNEGGEDFAGPQEQGSTMSEENDLDSRLITDIKASTGIEMSEDLVLKSSGEEGTTEQSQQDQPLENDASSQHPSQCLNLSTNLSNSSLSPSIDFEAPNSALSLMLSSSDLTSHFYISESNIEGPYSELIALNSTKNLAPYPETLSLPHSPSQQLPSPLPPGSADFSPSSTQQTDHSPSPSLLDLLQQASEAVSSTEGQDEKGETLQLMNNEINDTLEDLAKDMTEEVVSQQQFESGKPDNAACGKESNVNNEQQTREANKVHRDHIMEQTLKLSQENTTEINILEQQLECAQAEDVVCTKESYMTEEQLPKEVSEVPTDQIQTLKISKEDAIEVNSLQQQLESYMTEEQLSREVNEDPTALLEQAISQENGPESQTQTEVNILQQQFDNDKEDISCLKETYMTEDLSQKEANEDPAGLLEQTISRGIATDSQIQIEIKILQYIEPQTEHSHSSPPAPSNCEPSQSPLDLLTPSKFPSPPHESYQSDTQFGLLGMDSVCPSAFDPVVDVPPVAGFPETVPPPLHLDSCRQSHQLSSSYSSGSPPGLLPCFSTALSQEGSGSAFPDLPFKEEPQYPKSLWDAVNRIRKHTAPDSENEEEEVSELWDPESIGEDCSGPDVAEERNSEKIVFEEARQQEVSTEGNVEDVEVGHIQQDPCHEEPCGHAEEDTLSCSSVSSHGSGDTVIIADEDEVEEMPPDARTESKAENDEEFQTAEGEQCCSWEETHETKGEEDDGDGSVRNESSQNEECQVEVASTPTKAVELMETEQKDDDEEVFMHSEVTVSDERMIEREKIKYLDKQGTLA